MMCTYIRSLLHRLGLGLRGAHDHLEPVAAMVQCGGLRRGLLHHLSKHGARTSVTRTCFNTLTSDYNTLKYSESCLRKPYWHSQI